MESMGTGGVCGKISRGSERQDTCLSPSPPYFSPMPTLGDAVAAQDVLDVPEVVVIAGRVLALARLDRSLRRRRGGDRRRPRRDLPPGGPGGRGPDGLLAPLAPPAPAPPHPARHPEQHRGQPRDRATGPNLRRH